MECHEAIERMLAACESSLSKEDHEALDKHLRVCPSCGAEFGHVRAGADALRKVLDALAPEGSYLTDARLASIIEERRLRREPLRILTLRRFVAAAAVAAILVCGWFIYNDVASMTRPTTPAPTMAQAPRQRRTVPVRLVVISPQEVSRLRFVQGQMHLASTVPEWPTFGSPFLASPPRSVVLDSPGVTIPVENIYYDSSEANYWW